MWQVQTREDEVLLRGKLTNSGLRAGNPGKRSCSMWFLVVSLILCLRDQYCMFFCQFSYCFIEVSGFFPETAWRFNLYRQAAHQKWPLFLFWLEPTGDDEFLPGGATSFAFLLMFWWYSYKCACGFCDWCELVLLDALLDRNWLPIWGMERLRDDSVWID